MKHYNTFSLEVPLLYLSPLGVVVVLLLAGRFGLSRSRLMIALRSWLLLRVRRWLNALPDGHHAGMPEGVEGEAVRVGRRVALSDR